MRSRSNAHSSSLLVLRLLALQHQLAQVCKSACSICVCKDNICSSRVSHSMCNRSTFPSVLFQAHDSNCARRNRRWFSPTIAYPRSLVGWRRLAKLMCPCEVQSNIDSLICTPIADQNDLPPSSRISLLPTGLQFPIAATPARCSMMSVLLFQVLHCLFQHPIQSVHFVVCGNHKCHEAFSVGDLVGLFAGYEAFSRHFLNRNMIVIPARKWLWRRDLSFGCHSYVLLFGLGRWTRRGSEQPNY